jgi:L-rhamnose isomerase
VRWDSDHVVALDDELQRIMDEIVWNGFEERVFIGLDFFDASINRIGAWVTGVRAMRKALLFALLQPIDLLIEYEEGGNGYGTMSLLELQNVLPFGQVWDEFCSRHNVPLEDDLIDIISAYEKTVLKERT